MPHSARRARRRPALSTGCHRVRPPCHSQLPRKVLYVRRPKAELRLDDSRSGTRTVVEGDGRIYLVMGRATAGGGEAREDADG